MRLDVQFHQVHEKPAHAETNQEGDCPALEYKRCLSLLITTISGPVNATPTKIKNLSLYS